MNCPNCKTENTEGSNTCSNCGASLKTNELNTNIQNNINNLSHLAINYFKYLTSFIIKPYNTYKENEEKLGDVKESLIISGIIVVLMMIINLISSMVTTVITRSLFENKLNIDFSNLGNLNYIELIFKNLIKYAIFIGALALIYYIVGMLFKKRGNYFKTLSIVSSSLLPIIIVLISPIISLIWVELGIICQIIGLIYIIITLINLTNEEYKFENKNIGIYFESICLSITCIILYFITINIITKSLGF